MTDEEKKIVVDDDWKERAQAEKEDLEKKRKEQAEPEEAALASEDRLPEELPPASFSLMVSGFASNALVSLGQFPDPIEKKQVVQLPLAKHYIDMLGILEQKTDGNLDAEEKGMISKILHELRMLYVAVLKNPPETEK